MPRFAWTAIADEKTVRGVSTAESPRDVAERLRGDGYSVVSVSRRKWPPTNFHLESIRRRDIIDLTFKLIPLAASALPLNRVLDILRQDVKKHRIKNALITVKEDVNGGLQFSDALGKHADVFSPSYVSAVRAGEQGGDLPKALGMMGEFLEWLDDLVKQLWAILAYPILVFAAIVVLNFVLVFFAIPTFLNLYDRLGVAIEIPLPTRIVFAYSEFVTTHWPFLLALLGALVAVFMLRKRIPNLRYVLHSISLKTPFWGDIVRKTQSLQFCRFFQMLFENGVGVKRALREAQGVLANDVLYRAVGYISRRLDEGMTLAEAFEKSGQFPPLLAEQLHVGEESGDLGASLNYIVRYYDSEVKYSIQRFTAFLRPLMVFILAGMLLLLALSFYLPMFEIATLIETP